MAMVGDYVLALAACVLGAALLQRGRREIEVSIMVFAGGLLSFGAASLAGGVAHILARQLAGVSLEAAWRTNVLAIGLGSFCLLSGAILSSAKGGWRRFFLGLAAFKLIVFSFWMLAQPGQRSAVAEYASGLILLALISGWTWFVRRAASASWIIAGAAALLVVAFAHPAGISIHSSTEHNVTYALLQLVGLALLFRGGWDLHDRLA